MLEVAGFRFDPEQIRMTTGNDESERWKFHFGMFEGNRVDVAFDVIDRRQRFVLRESERLRISEPNEKRSDQPRPRCCCNAVDSFQIKPCVDEGLVHDG